MKFTFEVYEHRHKTVEIDAENYYKAIEKMDGMLDEIDMSDAEICFDGRDYGEVSAE